LIAHLSFKFEPVRNIYMCFVFYLYAEHAVFKLRKNSILSERVAKLF